ncbi:dihydrofolate reductase family protein [Cellulomonas carbonis]|uniref:Deaminase/reductase n=1 Tax=Cellulomonas carbonis T26 TaxID=947969 RepID=A0A0A0BR09_9CELL|nr:dihydrofolate reductase family protein [Cellulomonas carbonis]KGM10380.1 deaminase/reductase [Cellulomonas carbonis T26]GGB99806.1 deaminase [Cellulomonas carbonis]
MGKLIYAANASLDGYLEDEAGSFDWSVPTEEVHAFWNEHERGIGTSLYGRRMYEAMRVWEDDDWLVGEPAVVREYAQIWRDADKVVYSTTLAEVSTARTSLERRFDPEAVRRLKESSEGDLSVGGATLGSEAFRHGLVDECVLVLCPVVVGGGKPALPRGMRVDLELLDQRQLGAGAVTVRYAVRGRADGGA